MAKKAEIVKPVSTNIQPYKLQQAIFVLRGEQVMLEDALENNLGAVMCGGSNYT